MDGSEGILDALTLGFNLVTLGVATLLLWMAGAARKGIETAASEGAKVAIENVNWPRKLEQALEQTRGEQRQELRFRCYGALWAALRPLALYDSAGFDRDAAHRLAGALSTWYFSETGGLLLTREARNFYFALQDLLRAVDGTADWTAVRGSDDPRHTLRALLEGLRLREALGTLDYIEHAAFGDWADVASGHGETWKSCLEVIAEEARWLSLSDTQRFAVVQQAGSILRSALTADLESRLR